MSASTRNLLVGKAQEHLDRASRELASRQALCTAALAAGASTAEKAACLERVVQMGVVARDKLVLGQASRAGAHDKL